MKSSINLAQDISKKKTHKKPYAHIVIAFFIGVFTIAIGLIMINLFLKNQYGILESTENQLLTQINNQADKKLKIAIVSERSKNIQTLLGARGNLNERFALLMQQFPESVDIQSIDMNEGRYSITVETPSLALLNTLLEESLPTFLKDEASEISIVTIDSFQARGGLYAATIQFQYEGAVDL